jgi:hypothetical protein
MQPERYYYRSAYFYKKWNEAGYVIKIERPMITIRNHRENTLDCYMVEGEYSNNHFIMRKVDTGEVYTLTANEDRAILYNKREVMVFK